MSIYIQGSVEEVLAWEWVQVTFPVLGVYEQHQQIIGFQEKHPVNHTADIYEHQHHFRISLHFPENHSVMWDTVVQERSPMTRVWVAQE